MARQRRDLVAGTGYQYGDTDFLEYSERLYAGLADTLRAGHGRHAGRRRAGAGRGQAGATWRTPRRSTGIHQKALIEATLYGLPMVGVDLPRRLPPRPRCRPRRARPRRSARRHARRGPRAAHGRRRRRPPHDRAHQAKPAVGLDGAPDRLGLPLAHRARTASSPTPAGPALPQAGARRDRPATGRCAGVGFRSGTYTDTPRGAAADRRAGDGAERRAHAPSCRRRSSRRAGPRRTTSARSAQRHRADPARASPRRSTGRTPGSVDHRHRAQVQPASGWSCSTARTPRPTAPTSRRWPRRRRSSAVTVTVSGDGLAVDVAAR